jgi:hypothetical protein
MTHHVLLKVKLITLSSLLVITHNLAKTIGSLKTLGELLGVKMDTFGFHLTNLQALQEFVEFTLDHHTQLLEKLKNFILFNE